VEKEYKEYWESYGIYPLIQLSRTGPKYKPELLIVALHFYEKSTNIFQSEVPKRIIVSDILVGSTLS
jgi:hypothetical protein